MSYNNDSIARFLLFNFLFFYLCAPDDRRFRLHCKKLVEKFTNDVIDAAQRDLTVETANKIKALASSALNLIKPETVKLLAKTHGQIDKHFSIPISVPVGESGLQNTPDMDDYERSCRKDVAELELVYKQQAVMINHLKMEMELYDGYLMEQANIDAAMCDLFENNFTESNFNAQMIENVIDILKNIEIDIK